jgi:hypothetical protein
MTALPYIDTHTVAIDAPTTTAFDTVAWLATRLAGGVFGRFYARLVGCAGGVGFRVAQSDRPNGMVLRGQHRFSRYELVFEITPDGSQGSVLSAHTNAEFPGLHGALYRAAVIGSGFHRVAVRRILSQIKQRAEGSRSD